MAFITLLLIPFAILLNAFVFTRLWEWFITPLGVITIGMAHAYGIVLLVHFLTHQHGLAKENKGNDALAQATLNMFLIPLFAWGFGAIAHYFM
jgi:hypothetical protein